MQCMGSERVEGASHLAQSGVGARNGFDGASVLLSSGSPGLHIVLREAIAIEGETEG